MTHREWKLAGILTGLTITLATISFILFGFWGLAFFVILWIIARKL